MIFLTSKGIAKIPFLEQFLDADVSLRVSNKKVTTIAGWGRKKSGRRANLLAASLNVKNLQLEDGFLRSHGTGEHFPPLSLVVDSQGVYYDSTAPSALESLLNSTADLLDGITADVARAKSLILEHRLSKYNHAADCGALLAKELDSGLRRNDNLHGENSQPVVVKQLDSGLRQNDSSLLSEYNQRVLVIDQTVGDMSVTLGAADANTFAAMLAAAYAENPQATIYVKTHPEVTSGRKGGYLTHVEENERTVVLRDAINPLSLIEQMDKVYIVTSTMGFEAVLAGKPVSVFGLPWYAGWGVTDDRQKCARRTRQRSADELFAAAYFHYARYLNPVTHQRGTIFDVIDWLILQRRMTNDICQLHKVKYQ